MAPPLTRLQTGELSMQIIDQNSIPVQKRIDSENGCAIQVRWNRRI
jgi:hypothetical protein